MEEVGMEKRADDKPWEGLKQRTSLGGNWNGKKGRRQALGRIEAEDKPGRELEWKKVQTTSPG